MWCGSDPGTEATQRGVAVRLQAHMGQPCSNWEVQELWVGGGGISSSPQLDVGLQSPWQSEREASAADLLLDIVC